MDEIKLWRLDGANNVAPLTSVGELNTELQLEDTLVAHPELLEPGIELIGRQLPSAGGWLDLLGVDRDGRLVVFELKRGTLGRDAITQVLDYTSALAEMDLDQLSEHIADRSGDDGIQPIDDFADWYSEKFGDIASLFPARMALVGLGIDETALRIANFLRSAGHEIEVITFYGFRDTDSTLLARQLPVQRPPISRTRSGQAPISERRAALRTHLQESGLEQRFDSICGELRRRLPGSAFEDARRYGISFQLDGRSAAGVRGPRSYFGVYAAYTQPGVVDISLASWSLVHTSEALAELESAVELGYWQHGGYAIPIDSDERWEAVRPAVAKFADAVVAAWREYRQQPLSLGDVQD